MPGEGPLTGGGGVNTFKELSDTPASYSGQSGKTATVKATEDGMEFTTPAGGDMLVATYDPASKAAQILATSDIVTTIANPGLDTKVPSEQGVREALNAIDQKKIKATYFATIASGTTSGTVTKPAGAGADVDFIMDEWGTATDALVSTIENGKPTFKSPVNAAGATITTTFDTAGAYTFSDTPSPAADHALIYVYTCYLKNFNVAEALWETELLDYVADHAPTHTDGSDDIQNATTSQKGLASELATDAETVTGTDTSRVTTPSNITAKMAAPGVIGGTTPNTGNFTQVVVSADSNPLVDLNPSGTGTTEVIQITPVNALAGADVDWCGMTIDGAALDPGGVDNLICGFCVDFSGIDETNSPSINALCLDVPTSSSALHIKNGDIRHDYTTPTAAGAEYLAYSIIADGTNLDASSSAYMFDVSVTGGIPAGEVCAVRTRSNICPVRQDIGSYTSPSQTEYAGRKTGGGVTWADGIDGNEIFVQNSDAIYIGSTSQFSRIQVIMTNDATRSILPTFWYNTGADTWTQFYPSDATNGFQTSGSLAITLPDISATWTNDGDPGGADSSTGYWIKIVRTVAADPGTPTPTTMKHGTITTYNWDKNGNISVKSLNATELVVTNTGSGHSFLVEDSTSPDSTPFVIDADGKVGIGTDSPSKPLHVSGEIYSTSRIRANNVYIDSSSLSFSSANAQQRFSVSSNVLTGIVNSVERFRVDSEGNVGIGTTSPGNPLAVNRAADGIIVDFESADVVEGNISIAGSTTSYNAFVGSHYTQLKAGQQELPIGAVVISTGEIIPCEANIEKEIKEEIAVLIADAFEDVEIEENGEQIGEEFDRYELKDNKIVEIKKPIYEKIKKTKRRLKANHALDSKTGKMIKTITTKQNILPDVSGKEYFTYINTTNQIADKRTYGVWLGKMSDDAKGMSFGQDNKSVYLIAQVGLFKILVTEDGGNIEIGDYLETSIIPMMAQKQQSNMKVNSSVAKALISVDWSKEMINPEFGCKTKLIPCIF